MNITFECENCDKSFTIDEKFAGKKGQCKQCGALMIIPDGVASRAESRLPDLDTSPSRRPSAPTRTPREDIYGIDEPMPIAKHLPSRVEEIAEGPAVARQLRPRSTGLYEQPRKPYRSSGGSSGTARKVALSSLLTFLIIAAVSGIQVHLAHTRPVGLTSRADGEKIFQERLNLHQELVTALQGVTDVESARAASPLANQKIRELTTNLRIVKDLKALQTDHDALKAQYGPPLRQTAQQSTLEIRRIVGIPGAYDALDIVDAAAELDRVEKSIPGMIQADGRNVPVAPPFGLPPKFNPPPPNAFPGPRSGANRPPINRPTAGPRRGINRPNFPGPN